MDDGDVSSGLNSITNQPLTLEFISNGGGSGDVQANVFFMYDASIFIMPDKTVKHLY